MDKKNTYTYDEALEASVEYFGGDDLAAGAFVGKYALCDDDGVYYEKTPADMHRRIAKEFARIESKYANPISEEEIYRYLDRYKYIVPQGSPMSGIGNPFKIMSLGNCFVISSPYDSYGGIMKADQELAQLMKRRAGVGLDISNIRPQGVPTKNAAKTTDGIGVFMERFSNTCREVAQSGRRGAEMQTISVHHPEVMTFIKIKQDPTKVTGANISIRLSDEFMKAVRDDEDYEQRWPVDAVEPTISQMVPARDIWKEIIHAAWAKAEPGLLFWDTIRRNSPADCYESVNSDFKTVCTNPCGEIPMGPDSCRLMVVPLYTFVQNKFTDQAMFDYKSFAETVIVAQRLMDDLIDLELESIDNIIQKIEDDPEPEEVKAIEINLWKRFRKNCADGRRTGLGITGLGDALAALGIRYGSEESVKVTEEIYRQLAVNAYKSSCILAGERGAFPIFNPKLEEDHEFIQRILDQDPELRSLYESNGRRNVAITTTAPTGTVSTQTQTTSGIEPAFLLHYDRYRKVNPGDSNVVIDRIDDVGDAWQKYTVYHHAFKEWSNVTGKTDPDQSPYYKATSNDIDWVSSVDIQAAAQRWVCHAISKTCNIPADASEDLVADIYLKAWESGCKGFTVYRDGCRDGVLVKSEKKEEKSLVQRNAPSRPRSLKSETHKLKLDIGDGVKNSYVTVSFFPETKNPYEVFINTPVGNNIKDLQILELSARMTSLALRHGVDVKFIIDQLQKIDGQYIYSIPNSLAKSLSKYVDMTDFISEVDEGTINEDVEESSFETEEVSLKSGSKCPGCGKYTYILKEGCGACLDCGYSGCS